MKVAVAASRHEVEEFTGFIEKKYRIVEQDQFELDDNVFATVLTLRDKVQEDYIILEGLAKNYGIDIKRKTLLQPHCYYRRAVSYILVKRFGWSQDATAKQLNYNNHAIISIILKDLGDIEVADCPLVTAFKRCLEAQAKRAKQKNTITTKS